MAILVDTNILVYCVDSREPAKRAVARQVIRREAPELLVPHQALIEFVSVVTSRKSGQDPLLSLAEATIQVEGFMNEFSILYPNDSLFRTALRGMATYGFSWFDAHLWAYADHFGIGEILSEDFEHGRRYGTVRIRNPFLSGMIET